MQACPLPLTPTPWGASGTYKEISCTTCPSPVHTFRHQPPLPCSSGPLGTLCPCFRVGLECLRPAGFVYLCICDSLAIYGSRIVVLQTPPGRPHLPPPADRTEGRESQGCPPSSIQQGAPALRGEATPHLRWAAAGGGRTGTWRDHAEPVLKLP